MEKKKRVRETNWVRKKGSTHRERRRVEGGGSDYRQGVEGEQRESRK